MLRQKNSTLKSGVFHSMGGGILYLKLTRFAVLRVLRTQTG